MAHAEHLEAHRVNKEVGDQKRIAAKLADRQVFLRVVAHHQHIAPIDADGGQVFRIVVRLGLDGRGVLVRGDAREGRRIDAGPGQAPLHGAAREHGHGGQHQRIALGGKRVDGARGRGVRLHVFAELTELVLVEVGDGVGERVGRDAVGQVDGGQKLRPERLGVRMARVVGGHGGDAALHAGHELVGRDAHARHIAAERGEITLHERVDVHGKQRAVEVEEDGAVGSFLHMMCLSASLPGWACRRWVA